MILYTFNFSSVVHLTILFNMLVLGFPLLAQNLNPVTLMSSMSESSLAESSLGQDTHDGIKKSASADAVYEEMFTEEEDEDYYENLNVSMKTRAVTRSKSRKVAVKKSSKKTAKIEYCEYSD